MTEIDPTSHRFFSQRLALNYLDWGNPTAPPLVMVHGGMDHARNWDWLARELCRDWHIVCPDLRGHGDSAWSPDGSYALPFYVSDLAQIVHQLSGEPVSIVAHSLGGAISLRYASLYPERVRRLAVVEGVGISHFDQDEGKSPAEIWRDWIAQRRGLSARSPRRYATLDEALARMRKENGHLSIERATHLTVHGTVRNEDGTWSWKYDNYVRSFIAMGLPGEQIQESWNAIDCPVWLVHGANSWAHHPENGGLMAHFKNARVTSYPDAGHWVHHDQFDRFLPDLRGFLE